MAVFLRYFLLLIGVSFLMTIPLVYVGGVSQLGILAVREGLWFVATLVTLILYRRYVSAYRRQRKCLWLVFIAIIVFAIAISMLVFSYQELVLADQVYRIFVGLKYGYQWVFILLTASRWGYVMHKENPDSTLKLFAWSGGIFIALMSVGLVWQGAKIIRPETFQSMGYGPVGNRVPDESPPVYYRTGPLAEGGVPRLQGLFAGPNNYGYYLVLFFPLLLLWWSIVIATRQSFIGKHVSYTKLKKLARGQALGVAVTVLFVVSLILTFSRGAYLGVAVQFAIYLVRRRVISKRVALVSIVMGIGVLVAMSVWKSDSTMRHLIAKTDSVSALLQYPMGLGLGASGPGVHHGGSILPENYYMQIAIDTSFAGLLLWMVMFWLLLAMVKQRMHIRAKERTRDLAHHTIVSYMTLGLFGLTVLAMFLHAFEDSMVNYLFFGLYGVVLGSITPTSVTLDCPSYKHK